jgi:hypothetical protein
MRIPPADQIEIIREQDPPPAPLPDATPISELALTPRVRNLLRDYCRCDDAHPDDWGMRVVLTTVGDLRRESDVSLLRQQNFGHKALTAVREACGDEPDPLYTLEREHRPPLAKLLDPDHAQMVMGMRSVAGQLNWLADVIERAARKGSL